MELGLEEETPVFRMTCLDAATESLAFGLWDGAALNAQYQQMRCALERAQAQLDGACDVDRAAREAFELGSDAIRLIVLDPWLHKHDDSHEASKGEPVHLEAETESTPA